MNDVELFNHAEILYKDKSYEDAIEAYEKLKNNYPKSDLAIQAEIKICHAYFDDEKHLESADCYKGFKELHPSFVQIEFVYYRLALSYYLDSPKSVDRDLTNLSNALSSFMEFEKLFPESKNMADAKEKMGDARNRIAQKEFLIANFYFNRDEYKAAIYRYKRLLSDFPEVAQNEEALYKLGYSYYKIGKKTKAEETLNEFIQKYPQSKFLDDAQEILVSL